MRGDPPVTEVPDAVGLGAVDACAVIRGAGLVPRCPDSDEEPIEGVVVRQRPIAAAGAVEGDKVVLWTMGGRGAAVGASSGHEFAHGA